MNLSEEERKQIYEEEKAKENASPIIGQPKKKKGKLLPIIIGVVVLLMAIGAMSGDDEKTAPVSSEQPTAVETQTSESTPAFDFVNSEVTQENVEKAIVGIISSEKLKDVAVEKTDAGLTIDITYNPGEVWDEKALLNNSAQTTAKVYQVLFSNPKVDKVWVWTETNMTDAKGNTAPENVVNCSFTKENAKDVNWDKFIDMVTVDYEKLYNVADSYFIHPGILNAIKE